MRHINLFFILLFVVFETGCANDDTKEDIFKQEINVHGVTLIKSNALTDPWCISNIDSIIIVANLRGTPLIEIYDLKGKFLKKLTNKGKGKLDLLSVGLIQPDYNLHKFYIYDMFKQKILEYSVSDLLKYQDYEPTLYTTFKVSNFPPKAASKVFVINNNFVSSTENTKGRFLLIDTSGKHYNFFEKFPQKVDPSLSDDENEHLYGVGMAISPNKRNLATATYSAGLLNFYKLNQLNATPTWSYNEFLPSDLKRMKLDNTSVVAFGGQSLEGYSDICATNDFVYALYSGKAFYTPDYVFSNIIRVASWDGKKRFKLILDKNVNRISITKDNSKIFAISKNATGEPEIVTFTLPKLP